MWLVSWGTSEPSASARPITLLGSLRSFWTPCLIHVWGQEKQKLNRPSVSPFSFPNSPLMLESIWQVTSMKQPSSVGKQFSVASWDQTHRTFCGSHSSPNILTGHNMERESFMSLKSHINNAVSQQLWFPWFFYSFARSKLFHSLQGDPREEDQTLYFPSSLPYVNFTAVWGQCVSHQHTHCCKQVGVS